MEVEDGLLKGAELFSGAEFVQRGRVWGAGRPRHQRQVTRCSCAECPALGYGVDKLSLKSRNLTVML